ncbi:MAG: DUF4845 domain-containing protein [Pseudomonas sp.]
MVVVRSQKGLSVFGWLLALVLVAFFASAGFKVIPHYLDNMALEKMISAVETDKSLDIRTVSDFYNYLGKGMQINSIRNLDIHEALNINMQGEKFIAHLKYEKREALIKNIDLVVRFDQEFSVQRP